MAGYFDQYFNGIATVQNGGTALPQRSTLNFPNGGAVDNPGNNSTDYTPTVTYPLVSPSVNGITAWYPGGVSAGPAPATYSAIYEGSTTSGAHTAVQIGPNLPPPGAAPATGLPAPPTNGWLKVRYELEVVSTTLATPVGATYAGWATFGVHGATVVTGPSNQTVAEGTAGGSALPTGWSATLQLSGGQVQLVVTTDSGDTYTCKATLEWGYT